MLVRLVREMYEGVHTTVNTTIGESEQFKVKYVYNKGERLVLVLNVLSENIKRKEGCPLLVSDDLVIIVDTEEELQEKVWEWHEGLERGWLKVNPGKTVVMISSRQGRNKIHIEDRRYEVLKQVEKFKNLGAVISEQEGCETDVKNK